MTRRSFSPQLVLLAFLLFTSAAPALAQTLRTDSLFSIALGRIKRVTLLVPAHPRQLAVLVLLHGYGGSHANWTTLTDLARYADRVPLLVVMPDGENSWYVNQKGRLEGRYEDYIMYDLFTYVKSSYPVDTSRIAIAGLSMGGYGALVLGLRHPERFSFIGALSASLDVPWGIPDLQANRRGGLRASLVNAFGAEPSEFWREHDPFVLLGKLPSPEAPYLYLANGIQDDFPGRLALYRAFADSARTHGVRYEYHETPGRHDWKYWNRELHRIILCLRERWRL